MNSKAFTLSLIIAGMAMFMVYSYIDGREAEFIQRYGKAESVLIAKTDIQELELLDDSKVQLITVPQKFISPGALKSVKDAYNTIATVPILKGEQVTKPRITYPGARTGLARQVSIGKRAISIPINDSNGVSKLIKPGDRVDVIVNIDYAGGRKELMKAKTILQDVMVLATGLSVTNSIPIIGVKTPNEIRKLNLSTYTSFNTISLEVDPFQAQKLVMLIGSSVGKPYLALRNNDDKKRVRIKSTKIFSLLGEDSAEAMKHFDEQRKRQGGGRRGR